MNEVRVPMSSMRWWTADKEEDRTDTFGRRVADALIAFYDATAGGQKSRKKKYEWNLKMFNGRQELPGTSASRGWFKTPNGEIISLNVLASIERSTRARIAKSRPAPWATTDGASRAQQKSAEQSQMFLMGAIREIGLYRHMQRALDLGLICGEADIKVYPDFDGERLRAGVVYPWEAPVSEQDSQYGEPRCRLQVAYMDRARARALYTTDQTPQAVTDAILCANQSHGDEIFGFKGDDTDQIRIVEGWHLPSGKRADDGRHVIAIEGATLYDKPWLRDRFSMARFIAEPEPIGFFGTSICDELEGLQLEINDGLEKIREGHQLGGHCMILIQGDGDLNVAEITNLSHQVVRWSGVNPPTPIVVPAVAPEVYQWIWSLVERMYQIWGSSQLSANAQLPAGLQNASGKALRVYKDSETERFSYLERAYEQLMLDCCDLILDAAEDLATEVPGFNVRYQDNRGLRNIKWADVSKARDNYVLSVAPKSYLDEAPGGRVAAVQEQIQAGLIDPRMAASLLRDPDLRAAPDPFSASLDLCRQQVDKMLDTGVQVWAEDYQDLELARAVALTELQRAETQTDVPTANLQCLRNYVAKIAEQLKPPAPTPAPPGPPPGPMPPDAAMPPMPPAPVPPEVMQ